MLVEEKVCKRTKKDLKEKVPGALDGPSVTDGLFKRDLRGIGRNGLQFSLCLARPVRRFRGSRKLDWGLRGFLVTLLRGCTTFAEGRVCKYALRGWEGHHEYVVPMLLSLWPGHSVFPGLYGKTG
ncbi:hypothetical protein AVEN_149478-1 [Araneus ventricosus]|uniref:Uncharacterized protein n=1 Tax=Araneus ventricosus TaxID=182803 RepID=A0A4Y2SX64_ARAVE|nr:hypothetical protein AVEN_149478-1 [Araneus ventricosus]